MKEDCRTCKYYNSFYQIYDNDPLEASEYGRCSNEFMIDVDENFGEGFWCRFHKSIIKFITPTK